MDQETDYKKIFDKHGFLYLGNILDQQDCHEAAQLLINNEKNNNYTIDSMCPSSCGFYGILDHLSDKIKKTIEKVLNVKLYPTYSYARNYKKGEILWPHNDRPACEISITITLGLQGDSIWPIYFLNRDISLDYLRYFSGKMSSESKYKIPPLLLQKSQKVDINVGDGILYKGCDIIHWRDKFIQGNCQSQVFFHYVDANGPYKDHKYDSIRKGIINGSGY